MFARGSYGDADNRGTDLEADAATVADTDFRSDEAAGSRADVSAKYFSYSTTYCVSVVSADWPTDRGADASTFSSTYIVTDCPADRGTDTSTFSSTYIVTDCPADSGADASNVSGTDIATDCPANSGAYSSTFSAADGAADYLANGLAYEGAHGGAFVSADTATDCGADSITFGTTDSAADYPTNSLADIGADSGTSTATNTGTDRAAVATTLSAANCAADSVSNGEAVATTLSAANCAADSVSNGEAVATALSATDDSVSDGEAFFDADNGADITAVAPANYFAANDITTTKSDSDHEYAHDVNSDVRALRLAVISSGATPYGAPLQHANDRCAVSTAVSEPDGIADESPVAAAEPRSLGNSDREPDGRADSPPNALAPTDHVRSVAVAYDLAGPDDRTHAAGAARSARQHYLGPRHVGRQLDGRGLRRRGEHLSVVRWRHPRGSRGFDRPPAAEALVVHRRQWGPPRAERGER